MNSLADIIAGIFLVLHGLVHLLYFGQSARFFELQSGMVWPDGSWAFTRFFGEDTTRTLEGAACMLVAIGFVVGGAGLFASQAWWGPLTIGSTVLSTVIFVLFWDGQMQALANKGLFAILINIAILVSLLSLHWPRAGL